MTRASFSTKSSFREVAAELGTTYSRPFCHPGRGRTSSCGGICAEVMSLGPRLRSPFFTLLFPFWLWADAQGNLGSHCRRWQRLCQLGPWITVCNRALLTPVRSTALDLTWMRYKRLRWRHLCMKLLLSGHYSSATSFTGFLLLPDLQMLECSKAQLEHVQNLGLDSISPNLLLLQH